MKKEGRKRFDFDDKDIAMVCITILVLVGGGMVSYVSKDPTPIIMSGITALGTMATGAKGLKRLLERGSKEEDK